MKLNEERTVMANGAPQAQCTLNGGRIVSMDAFRGLTMLLMLWVNDLNAPDLGRIKGVPRWLKHMPARIDGMTFVDVILPAFLFIVGIAVPIALSKRIDRGESPASLWRHILVRTLGLTVIGLCMVNTYRFHPTAMPVGPAVWEFLLFVSVILIWNRYPSGENRRKGLFIVLPLVGALLLIFLVIVFRGQSAGQITWMRTSWWGVLTFIAIGYFVSATAYLLFRKHLAGMMGVLALLTAFNIGDKAGLLKILDPVREYFKIGGFVGGFGSITVAGVIIGMFLLQKHPVETPQKRVLWLSLFSLGLFTAGLFLRPLHGIVKLRETPSWCLISSGLCCAVFAFLYWLMDVKHVTSWARFLRPAGLYALLTYILPHMMYSLFAIVGFTFFENHWNSGFIGILRSLAVAFGLVALTGLLTRLGVRLRL